MLIELSFHVQPLHFDTYDALLSDIKIVLDQVPSQMDKLLSLRTAHPNPPPSGAITLFDRHHRPCGSLSLTFPVPSPSCVPPPTAPS